MKVVISYATKNFAWVERVRAVIATEDIDVFIAEYDAPTGADLLVSIESAIDDADLVVVLWSREARESNWVRDEVSIAKGKNKMIIPVVLDDDRNLPQFVKDLKYIDVTKNPDKALADLKKIIDSRATQKNNRQLFGVLMSIVGVIIAAAA